MLDVRELSVGWGPTRIVERVGLRVAPGRTECIVGTSGCGKTTLLMAIAGLGLKLRGVSKPSSRGWASRERPDVSPRS